MVWVITPAYRGAAVSDPDAQTYLRAVETADGQALEPAVARAVNEFVLGCKADGIWTAIKASCILAGARTLAGALVPLVGTAPTNFNFVSGDYDRKTGLVGNGSTKYLNSNYAYPTALQNNCHISSFFSTVGTGNSGYASIGTGTVFSVSGNRLYNENIFAFTSTDTTSTGFRGSSRSSSTQFIYRRAGINEIATINSVAITHGTHGIFARRLDTGSVDTYSTHRLAFYSIGESLNLALLDARVTTLINAFATAIP